MRLTAASCLLAAAATSLLSSTVPGLRRLLPSAASLFAEAGKPMSCPGGAAPDSDGSCPNPDAMTVGAEEEDDDSSDDSEDGTGSSGNPHAHQVEEGEEKPPTTCDSYLKLAGFKDAVYETRSFYQEVAWSENANKPDVCMSLDDILQICHSYRPHYHEPYVHFPAAYLQEMKRIVFIGGGDAMLLHESLKYPNVELVLGLELDQKVVRESMKHFHIQPHFDDPRVQWWFGDAAKSLALLPREWFGTFDLVMVDLSETVMSVSVTDDLDIFGALSLLLKPDGIFVKNELYYGQMSVLFDHSAFVYMTDYPILCDQDWAMGSNTVDFLHPKIDGGHMETNDIRTFEYTPLEDEDEHYKLIKDYSRNDARKQGKCDLYDKELAERKANGGELAQKEVVKPVRSAGVLLVVEAEEVSNFKPIEDSLRGILASEGLHPLGDAVSHSSASGEATSAVFIGLEEGYVNARYYPGKRYAGFEVVLWSEIAKNTQVRDALLAALNVTENFSNFRVVHGGMLGAKNWREDVEATGPVNRNLRQCDPDVRAAEPQAGAGPIPAETFNAAVAASLTLLPKKMDKVVAVLCGEAGTDECEAVAALAKNTKVDKVVAVWACADRSSYDDEDDKVSNVYVCSPKDLKRSAKIEEGYSAVVVDPAASEAFVRSMSSELCSRKDGQTQQTLLRDQVAMFTSLANDAEATLFAGCVKGLVKDRVRSARIVIDGTAQFGIIGTDSPGFVRRVASIKDSIQKKTGIRTVVEKMVGGPVQQQQRYDPEHYPPNAYDEHDALVQYTNQIPLASQSLYQLEISDAKDVGKVSAKLIRDVVDGIVKSSGVFPDAVRKDYAKEVGDGSLSAAVSNVGHLIVTWDGGSRLTVNTLTVGEAYEPVVVQDPDVPDMVLTDHKAKVVDALLAKLPPSAGISVREQMPRGSGRTVNFKKDINAVPNCADHYDLCLDFSKEGECDDDEEQPWMEKYCSLSCGTCDKMWMGGPPPLGEGRESGEN